MATLTKMGSYPDIQLPLRPEIRRKLSIPGSFPVLGLSRKSRRRRCWKVCRGFKEEGSEGSEERERGKRNLDLVLKIKGNGREICSSIKSGIVRLCKFPSGDENRDALAELEKVLFSAALHIGRYIVTMMSTGVVLLTGFQLSGGEMNDLIWYSWLGGVIIGTMVGANMVMDEHSRAGPRNVVITGSTRGLGKALAREFLLSGDRVVVTSRSADSVDDSVKELEENLRELEAVNGKSQRYAKVVGIPCDVCDPNDVRKLANFAVNELGSVDIWIVSTNLVGSVICTREAMRVITSQKKGGHIFNMDGAGSGGSSTPLTAVYGSTKCGLRQLQSSLLKECRRTKIGVHTASPGMVLTELLLSGSSLKNKQMFNIICELPETVARSLVPRMRVVKGSGKAINYLTPPRILLALVTSWLRRGRWFDDKGRALYAAEADRIRNWAENRTRFSFTDAMEMYTENTWVSVFSLSVVCAFIILSSTGSSYPGT
ncbi:probable chlorophyll(ide) b reductase NYC1, chloroplastic isoform X2 [Chenopodium quinoa]|uniref:probable chlorophyll(ide) b reductase NYC1, chloroplastic isoform X2 n=1 Tax=Chenopodium quinoa TaxID=63459 RepID=UPI000B779AC2|nr:probable chlorophyll(ide) b reductase NYC1, chloroplastic isoform X2 [Chenopodium quinoa]